MPHSPAAVMIWRLFKHLLIFSKRTSRRTYCCDLHVDCGHFLPHLACDQEC